MRSRLPSLLVFLHVMVLAAPRVADAGGPDFGPSEAEIRQARRLAATFRRAGGIERAMRIASRDESTDDLASQVAVAVLLERVGAAMPTLLDALAAGDAPGFEVHAERMDDTWKRYSVAERIVTTAVCFGKGLDDIVRLITARQTRDHGPPEPSQVVTEPPPRDPLEELDHEMTTCRAEAGRKPVAATGITTDQADQLAMCLRTYLCGPSPRTLVRTLDRCCGKVLGAQKPAFCRA